MKDFIELVRAMRAAQKEYFRTRTGTALKKSKALEKQVDDFIKAIDDKQLKLFP